MHDCEKYAENHGLTIVDTYIDRALTATSDRRPAFQKMINDSNKNLFDTVLVWKLDRFARNRYDSAVYKRQLRLNGVNVVSVMENITDTPEGVLMESVLEGFAEYFSRDLSQKVQRGMKETAEKHKIVGKIPFGYKKSCTGTYEPDDMTAPAVKTIFTMYARGERKTDIADYLNSHGYRTSTGCKFTKARITPIIQNSRYTGKYKYSGIEYNDENQRIISDELFNKAQEQAALMKHRGGANRATEKYILSGKLYCGYCGQKMNGEAGTSKTGAKHFYYLCSGRKKHHICDTKSVKKECLETFVINSLSALLKSDDIINRIADAIIKIQNDTSATSAVVAALENKLKETDSKINNIISAIEQGIISPTTKQRLQELETLKGELAYEIDVKRSQDRRFTKPQLLNFFKSVDLNEAATPQEKQAITRHFIKKIYLWEDRIVIFYNFSNRSGSDDTEDAEFENLIKTALSECSDNAVFGTPDGIRTHGYGVGGHHFIQLNYGCIYYAEP